MSRVCCFCHNAQRSQGQTDTTGKDGKVTNQITNQSFIVIVKSKQKHYLTLIEVEIDIFFDIDNVMDAKICPEIDIDPFLR